MAEDWGGSMNWDEPHVPLGDDDNPWTRSEADNGCEFAQSPASVLGIPFGSGDVTDTLSAQAGGYLAPFDTIAPFTPEIDLFTGKDQLIVGNPHACPT